MRKEDIDHDIGDVFWFFLFATLLLLPFPFIYGFGDVGAVLPWILGLGALSTGLGYLFYNLALEKIEAEIASIVEMIGVPIISVLLAVIIINEDLSAQIIIGGLVLVISGVYLELHNKELNKS
jgi:drug/metabolite transporter (DMT)-like permease